MKVTATKSYGLLFLVACYHLLAASEEATFYDYSAYTECKYHPEAPLYNGGILAGQSRRIPASYGVFAPSFLLFNLTETTRYSFSCWVKIDGTDSSLVKATVSTDYSKLNCIGTVLARSGCWSFLKGGFVLDSDSEKSILYFQGVGKATTGISIASASLQPFSVEEWSMHQGSSIKRKRMRTTAIHVLDSEGNKISSASVSVQQISKEFPFGSAIARTILQNKPYQDWFTERFNAAVFENELKWYATEPQPGKLNYAPADAMLDFVMANKIITRGHNIFWEDPMSTPSWVRNLTGERLKEAVNSRIQSLLFKYKGQFIHWDVNNEMLHFDFYEQQLGHNASMEFFHTAQQSDPLATLFMNEFNVIETCDDAKSTVDTYIAKLKELKKGGAILEGIGLEGHFLKPNIPLMRAILDKLATLDLPIWLTEVDISNKLDQQQQAMFLEEVLREGFSYASVNGMMLWSALHPEGCYQMCLTDGNLQNLPTGDVVDKLLQEWRTKEEGKSDDHGEYSFSGYLGEYKVLVSAGNQSTEATFFLSRGDETKHFNIQIPTAHDAPNERPSSQS